MPDIFDLDDDISEAYISGMDSLISQLGKVCEIEYPGVWQQCTCNTKLGGIQVDSHLQDGGIIHIDSICHLCSGTNKVLVSQTENVKLLCTWNPREIRKSTEYIGSNIMIPYNAVKTVGHIRDLPKILMSRVMIMQVPIEPYIRYKFKLFNEPIDHGIVQGKYFSCLWERAG